MMVCSGTLMRGISSSGGQYTTREHTNTHKSRVAVVTRGGGEDDEDESNSYEKREWTIQSVNRSVDNKVGVGGEGSRAQGHYLTSKLASSVKQRVNKCRGTAVRETIASIEPITHLMACPGSRPTNIGEQLDVRPPGHSLGVPIPL